VNKKKNKGNIDTFKNGGYQWGYGENKSEIQSNAILFYRNREEKEKLIIKFNQDLAQNKNIRKEYTGVINPLQLVYFIRASNNELYCTRSALTSIVEQNKNNPSFMNPFNQINKTIIDD
jgi:hypothetical protein